MAGGRVYADTGYEVEDYANPNFIKDMKEEKNQPVELPEKSMYGRKYMGVLRTTFIIDEQGIIERVITKVNTKNAAEQILKK